MSDEINRTSRASDEVKNERKKVWTPPSSLDAPPAPDGFVHRWIRTESMGYQDTANVSKKMREGWEFVRAEEIKNKLGDHSYPTITEGTYAGLIGVAGLVLGRIPEEIVKSRAEYFKRITQDRIDAVDNDVMKEQRPEMPMNINRQSRVTFGGGSKS
jgi:hypothetical protein|tara:strand:+ start:9080 stop:9550 length:471 start_codon:yes stop_codon:yes gene_type:complete